MPHCSTVGTLEDDFYRSLGLAIRRQRRALDLTQDELGQRLEPRMTRASIANIESGKQRLLVHRLVDIADELEIKLSKLIAAARPKQVDGPTLEKELAKDLEAKLHPKNASDLARKVTEMTQKLEARK